MYQHIKVPEGGQKIKVNADFSLVVPDQPVIPFIEGDGVGIDTTPVMIKVVDAAVQHAVDRVFPRVALEGGNAITRLIPVLLGPRPGPRGDGGERNIQIAEAAVMDAGAKSLLEKRPIRLVKNHPHANHAGTECKVR